MKLSLNLSEARQVPWPDDAVDVLRRIASKLGGVRATVEMTVVSDQFIQKLNRDYRGIDRPTDVISFSYLDEAAAAPVSLADDTAGEIYVSHETLARDAKAQGIDIGHLFLRIGVHGLLHVLGFDHETDEAAVRMETKERDLLLDHLEPSQVEALF